MKTVKMPCFFFLERFLEVELQKKAGGRRKVDKGGRRGKEKIRVRVQELNERENRGSGAGVEMWM